MTTPDDTTSDDTTSDETADGDRSGRDARNERTDERHRTGAALDADSLVSTYPSRRYDGQVHERFTIPARAADVVPAGDVLPATLASKVNHDLWSHQAAGLDALADGENVVVSTSTSSGKTLIYALHVARAYLTNPETRALLVYPTKALSRDQETELNDLLRGTLGLDVTVGVYDGDTESGERPRIRSAANVVITNFVGLNQYLESHHLWAEFFAECSLFVVDEAHSWTGLSGMHVAWLCRRAKRIVEYYGGDPQFVLTSATIGNPADHAAALTGEPARVVDDDGSPRGRRDLVFWNPPHDGDANADGDGGEGTAPLGKRPATVEAPEVWAHCCGHDVQSLLFCDSRKQTELAVDRGKSFLRRHHRGPAGDVALEPYNAGHGKQSRRATERGLSAGRLDGVATTSALEVGINVGGVDGTVLMGYPGSRQSFWQRIGRSGRDTRDALSVFVPDHATLDEYVLQHPDYVLEEDHENAVVDLANNPVYLQHLFCAAQELPVTRADAERFGGLDRLRRAVEYGRRTGDLEGTLDDGVRYAHRDRPQDRVSLYASGGRAFDVRLAGDDSFDHQSIGRERAYRDYHEGATVRYRGDQYQVTTLREDVPRPYVELEPADVDYYTQSQGTVTIRDTESETSREIGDAVLHWGYGTVSIHYRTYMTREVDSGDVRDVGLETGVPPVELRTQLCWLSMPDDLERALLRVHGDYRNSDVEEIPPRLHGYLGGIHAVEHAMIAVAPLELSVDAGDLGGLATNRLPGTADTSGWFVYDAVEGGVGFSRAIYDNYEAVARRARALVEDCPCGRDDGCPACLMSDRCGNDNQPLYGPAATDVLSSLLGDLTVADLRERLPDEDDEERFARPGPPASIS